MTGWRLGYAAGPAAIISQMTKLQQYTFVCAPSPLQYAALAALDVPMTDAVAAYREKRDIVVGELQRSLNWSQPAGGVLHLPQGPRRADSASEFVAKAIENNVLIIPGNVFSERDTHFRISYATTDEKLKAGCEILRRIAKKSGRSKSSAVAV